MAQGHQKWTPNAYLIFVISFTQAGFLNSKVLHPKTAQNTHKLQQIPHKRCKICSYLRSIWKILHWTDFFYTGTARGARDKYEVCTALLSLCPFLQNLPSLRPIGCEIKPQRLSFPRKGLLCRLTKYTSLTWPNQAMLLCDFHSVLPWQGSPFICFHSHGFEVSLISLL